MVFLEFSPARQRCVLLSYIAAFILGLPYWWYTTTVPRSSLPYADIASLESVKTVPISLGFQWDPLCSDMVTQHGWSLAPFTSNVHANALESDVKARFARLTKHRSKPLTSNPTWSLSFQVVVDPYKPDSSHAYLNRVCAISSSGHSTLPVGSLTVSESGVVAIIAEHTTDFAPALAAYAHQLAKLVADPYKSVPFSESYEILLSLMVQNPSATPIRSWSAPKVSASFLRPFLQKLLGNASRFKLVTQIQYLTIPGEGVDLPSPPAIGADHVDLNTGKGNGGVQLDHIVTPVNIPSDQLPLFINPDWNLGSVTPNHTTVHLVTFIPDPSTPMSILDDSGNMLDSNSFLSPRWGGVTISNVAQNTPVFNETHLHPLVPVWITHLRTIFGVIPLQGSMTVSNRIIEFQQPNNGISTTEIALYHLSQYVVHTTKAADTLQALIRLTESLHNLPISKKIAMLVHGALHTIHAALGLAPASDDSSAASLVEKYQTAWEARTYAEWAFFDSDMVGLAFFPQEHKFAVYMPFFVPILVTVLMVVVKEIQLWRGGK